MSAAAAFIPTELDNYIFISPRAESAWIGLDKRTNENVLIRVIERASMSEKDLSSLTAEIALLQKLNHPLVAKFHEVVSTDTYFFFVTDPPKSHSVREYVSQHGYVSEDKAQEFLAKYVEVTDYLSGQTLRSFVLTIDSVFVDDTCDIVQVYVYYQSSAFATEWDTQFKAPEVLKGQQYGPPASVWCAGVFLYFISTGQLPFTGNDEQQVEKNVLSKHPTFPDHLSPNLTAFLGKMLTKNPVTRITMRQFSGVPWMREASSTVLSSFTRLEARKGFMTDLRLAQKVKQSGPLPQSATDDESGEKPVPDGRRTPTKQQPVRRKPFRNSEESMVQ